jgi:outer membrane protein OmpA-like peptidoglycan-associated protein
MNANKPPRTVLSRAVVTSVLVSSFWTGSSALAQSSPGFAINRSDLAGRGSEWFFNDTLDTRGHKRMTAGTVLDWGHEPLVFRADDGSEGALVRDQLFAHLGGSIMLVDRLRLAAALPVALLQSGDDAVVANVNYAAPSGPAVGDLRLAADFGLFGAYREPISVAAGVRAWLPTGSRRSYSGDEDVRVGAQVSAAGEVTQFVYGARVGLNYRGLDESFAGVPLGSELPFGAAAGVRVLDGAMVIGPEISGSTVLVNGGAFSQLTTPIDLVMGAHYTRGSWRFGAGAGPGLTSGVGTPSLRGLLSVEYVGLVVTDLDEDGVFDQDDACPTDPGADSTDPRSRGCPADVDADGIEDRRDACPNESGPADSDSSRHGCPAPADADSDGVVDAEDACPALAGVSQPGSPEHGCPPHEDRDGDQVVDAEDVCPDEPGELSSESGRRGCPTAKDADQDGIVDANDACPAQAGSASDDATRHGCPQAVVSGGTVELTETVRFELGSAAIHPDSHQLLADVVRAIQSLPEGARIRVEGHTDSVGKSAVNVRLSQARAESVVAWLVRSGISAGRLTAAGLGDQRPLADNATDEGRRSNRRVEFHIVEEGGTPQPSSTGPAN